MSLITTVSPRSGLHLKEHLQLMGNIGLASRVVWDMPHGHAGGLHPVLRRQWQSWWQWGLRPLTARVVARHQARGSARTGPLAARWYPDGAQSLGYYLASQRRGGVGKYLCIRVFDWALLSIPNFDYIWIFSRHYSKCPFVRYNKIQSWNYSLDEPVSSSFLVKCSYITDKQSYSYCKHESAFCLHKMDASRLR